MPDRKETAVLDHKRRVCYPDVGAHVVEIVGAGYLAFGPTVCTTGGTVGISADCSWTKWGYSGGVMSIEEVEGLVVFLQKWLTDKQEAVETLKARLEESADVAKEK